MALIFDDICDLQSGRAFNVVAHEETDVPVVDVFVAGFVCKSVSTENTQRGDYGECIDDGTGQTGESFQGVLGYARRFRPKLVICENVAGLLKRNRGRNPQIHSVRAAFEKLGYSYAHMQFDARNFLVPQRRTRVWMWAIRLDVAAAPAAQEVQTILQAMERPQPMLSGHLFKHMPDATWTRQTINEREQDVLDSIVDQNRSLQCLEAEELADLVVDISKSAGRAPWCVGATPCVLPNSRLHWRREKRVLDAREMAALQGIWPRDFPVLESWCQSEKRSLVVRDMAGNAFTSTICTAVCLGVMVAISPCLKKRKTRRTCDDGKRH